ncbi:unnamed protein product [Schistocephalus solidus]|uniref:Inorganic diphosphatase n=1 Tax=Schistocephalus solidus TaxID=70667 RepID=A0A183SNZ1_SCHSO|nr:unnamed protein product [Schistocephalus solidus]
MPCDDRMIPQTWDFADAAAGRALVRQPKSFNPFYGSSLRNKLSSQLVSDFLPPSTEPGQKVVLPRVSPINLACYFIPDLDYTIILGRLTK